jgi:hypothetical protein
MYNDQTKNFDLIIHNNNYEEEEKNLSYYLNKFKYIIILILILVLLVIFTNNSSNYSKYSLKSYIQSEDITSISEYNDKLYFGHTNGTIDIYSLEHIQY